MVDEIGKRKLYKIPSDEKLNRRREFFRLERNSDDSMEKWLDRVCSLMDDCDFPEAVEYIFTDKFMCELDIDERQRIRNADTSWIVACEIPSNSAGTATDLDDTEHLIEPKPSTSASSSIDDKTTTVENHDDVKIIVKILKCRKCKAKFTDRKALIKHTNTVHPKKVGRYICEVCDNMDFLTLSALQEHTLIHAKEKYHVCKHCKRTYRQLSRLIQHKKQAHPGTGRYACRLCGKRFLTGLKLKQHTFVMHNDEKPFHCNKCKKGFVGLQQMNKHKLMYHREVFPYPCEMCAERFQSVYYLKKHLNDKHRGSVSHKCDTCGRTFIHLVALTSHKKYFHREKLDSPQK